MTYLAYLGLILIVGIAGGVLTLILNSVHPQAALEVFRLAALAFAVAATWRALTGRCLP